MTQDKGIAFVSNAIVEDRYLLRACLVNFRTTREDIDILIDHIIETGNELDKNMRP